MIITQRIVGPIARITRIMRELSGGRMSVTIPPRRGASEIKATIDALVVFKDNAIAREELESSTRSQNRDLSALTSEAATDNMRLVNELTHSSDVTSREMVTLREIVGLFHLPSGEAEIHRVARDCEGRC